MTGVRMGGGGGTHRPCYPALPTREGRWRVARKSPKESRNRTTSGVRSTTKAIELAPERLGAFVESTDPKVTTCEAWKSLMQFRHELRTNPRQDSGDAGWWSRWIGTMQRWLYGGGDWGCGYYEPGHRVETPDCAVRVADVVRWLDARCGCKQSRIAPADEHKTMLFRAGTTYLHEGILIDWAVPFPPIAARGAILEWIESWLDRVTFTEATGRYPWERTDSIDRVAERTADIHGGLSVRGDNGDAKPPAHPAGGSLTSDHDLMLAALAAPPVGCKTVTKLISIGKVRNRETAGRLMDELKVQGMVYHPYSKNKGYALTASGNARIAELKATT